MDLSKNYFWALKAIEISNGSLEALVKKWEEYRDIPVPLATDVENLDNNLPKLMASLPIPLNGIVSDIEVEMQKLRDMIKLNDKRRQEIRMQLQEVLPAFLINLWT